VNNSLKGFVWQRLFSIIIPWKRRRASDQQDGGKKEGE